MTFQNDFNIGKLFLNKDINIVIDHKNTITLKLKTVKDLLNDSDWVFALHLLTLDIPEWKAMLQVDYTNTWDYICFLIFDLGKYKQFNSVVNLLWKNLQDILPDIEKNHKLKEIKIKDLTITPEIWDYVVYLVRLSCGEKIMQPRIFNSPEEKAFYLKQQEMDSRIKKIKKNKETDEEGLIKAFLAITYSFPSLTFDYLFNQTMAQIHWLQKLAAGEVSYRINSQVLAAGNMKKGSKLKFFIE